MFYRIRDGILFRRYSGHGYITDNSEFGYRFLNDTRPRLGETFVSDSGGAMLSKLSKAPRNIDDIVAGLMRVFRGVEYEELKSDTIEFFHSLAEQGYLCEGKTPEACLEQGWPDSLAATVPDAREAIIPTESCAGDSIDPNDFLRSIHFDVSSACNERCAHCYIPDERKTTTIDPELFSRVLEEARALNAIHVTLSGGEPLLHRDFTSFLKRCRELDLSVNVLSNLTLLTDDIIAEMMRNPLLSVQTSLYSMDPNTHDSITGLAGSFEKTVDGLLRVINAGIPVQISCPVMKQSKDCFLDVVLWGKEHGIAVAVEPVIFASHDHSGSNLDSRISLEDLESVLDKEMSEGYAAALSDSAKEKEALTGNDPICSVCRYSLCVSAEGNVFPCAGWQSNVLGDLNQQTLKEVWEGSEKLHQLRGIKRKEFAKCVSCEDRGYCTVCMMANANENPSGDPLLISDFRCKAAAMTHRKVEEFLTSTVKGGSETPIETPAEQR